MVLTGHSISVLYGLAFADAATGEGGPRQRERNAGHARIPGRGSDSMIVRCMDTISMPRTRFPIHGAGSEKIP